LLEKKLYADIIFTTEEKSCFMYALVVHAHAMHDHEVLSHAVHAHISNNDIIHARLVHTHAMHGKFFVGMKKQHVNCGNDNQTVF
jgi:hypothetical protein